MWKAERKEPTTKFGELQPLADAGGQDGAVQGAGCALWRLSWAWGFLGTSIVAPCLRVG